MQPLVGSDFEGYGTGATQSTRISTCSQIKPNVVYRSVIVMLLFLIIGLLLWFYHGQGGGPVDEVDSSLTALQNKVGDLTKKFQDQKHRTDELFKKLEQLMIEKDCADKADFPDDTNVTNHIAFSAYLAHDLDDLGPDQTVIFENVILNDGGAYNPLLGTFAVPRAGLYFLTVTLQTFEKHRQWFKLVADGEMKSELLFYPNGHQMATNTALLRLNEGQTLWIAVSESEKGVSLQNGHTSSFSGFFLHE